MPDSAVTKTTRPHGRASREMRVLGPPVDRRRRGRNSPDRGLPWSNRQSSCVELNRIALSSSGSAQDSGCETFLGLIGALFARECCDGALEHAAEHRNGFWIVRFNGVCPNHIPVSQSPDFAQHLAQRPPRRSIHWCVHRITVRYVA